ncbi:NAD(P)H-dependent oxidoreductase [Chitinophaga vietnamensis]|uniref:NAD(P)H-dependent oxidoreductase n=1 Tax=Chitinophaga vietnamensis TaxID=2593957 RepID=UPI00117850F6|nr:NAD(P)H-dependent oxidoreductase [Chitinophaga vietnamensis]
MSKTLVIVIHPDMQTSVVNKRWITELKKYPDHYFIHDLHAAYPSGEIDIASEQALLEQHNTIIFQFPFYWFNCPPLLKKWLDDVLTDGWAYGRNSGYKMGGKKVALAISAGIAETAYTAGGKYKYTLEQLTAPFEITFQYVRANYRPLFAFYGGGKRSTPEKVDQSARDYLAFVQALN